MKQVFHVVLLRFKDGQEAIAPRLDAALAALQKLPGMVSYRGGAYSSPEGLNQGFTHGFIMTFTDAQARDRYLGHPEHEKVKAEFLPFVDKVVAFDFEA